MSARGPAVARTREELRSTLADTARPRALVPTMGALHEGHAALIRRARTDAAMVVVSIFVNPTQFDRPDDLAAYPRDLAGDLALCASAGADVVFIPEGAAVYPEGSATIVDPGPVAHLLEGAARPGHFAGVATVVTILLDLVAPDRAYFGQKDAQQLVVVRQVVRDLGLAVEIVGCPTVREPDGLALSSRNRRLAPGDRIAAVVLRRALVACAEAFAAGEADADRLRATMLSVLATEPRASVDYVSVADPETLAEASGPQDGPLLLSLAASLGGVRLIDCEALPRR